MPKKFLSYLPHILAMLFVAGFAVFAWTEPTQAPPAGNVATPINISATEQIKSGNLTVNALGVSASGNALLVPNGNVGIGTASPGAKLEVAGQVKITGGSPGNDKILKSDASGMASWADPSSTLPPGSLMGEWWVSGNPVCRCYSDSNCSLPIGYKDGVSMINVNNNSVVNQNCPYAFTVCDSGVCQPTAPGTTFFKCAAGLTEKSFTVDAGGEGSLALIKLICTK